MDVAEGDLIRQGLAVLLVFALLTAAVWRFRSGGVIRMRASGPRMTSAGRLVLTPQHAVHLIRIDGRELVVATHPQGCSVLGEGASTEMRKATA